MSNITYLVKKPYTLPQLIRDNQTLKPYVDYDLDAEAAVLGICINESYAFGSVYGLLTEECFFDSGHLAIYNGLKFLFENGYSIDGIVLNSILQQQGKTEIKGLHDLHPLNTVNFICRLSYGVFSSEHLETWCLLLRQLAAKRLMDALTTKGLNGADVFESAAEIDKMLKKVMEVRATDDWHHISAVGVKALKLIESRDANKIPGITTSISILDQLNGGFRAGELIVIGARPSVGKSAFMGRIATHAAFNGNKVGLISLEMENTSVFSRMLSADAGMEFYKIDRNQFHKEEQERQRVYSALSNLSNLPIYFSDTSQVNVYDIRAKADKLQRKHGLDILLIDYLQLIEPETDKASNREQQVSKMTRGLKLLAKSLHVPIILLAQLNRQVMDKGDNKPQLHHLRESGSIEQDADIVMFIHRDFAVGVETNANGESTEKEADLLVRKWRNGTPIEIKIGFEPTQMRFFDPEAEAMKQTPEFKTLNPHAGIRRDYRQIPTSSQDTKHEETPF